VSNFHVRHLPHYCPIGQPLFVTWRLHGSMPAGRCYPAATESGKAFLAMDRILDSATTGPLYLSQPDPVTVVVNAIRNREANDYDLHAFVVMANHVHLLFTPKRDVSKILHSLKRFTARECNRILGRTGQPFWQDESYDRLVRDPAEFKRIVKYIEMNPVRAGLADYPEAFPWSSARRIDNPPQVGNLHYTRV